MKFSYKEKKDLFFAGIMISLAFAILLSGGFIFNSKFPIIFVVAFFSAGMGFLFHELMHKYVAQNYGFVAEFKASYKMLWFAIFLSFFGFIIAAPGAVFIRGRISKEENGKISLAGPMTNLVLSILFLMLILLINSSGIFKSFLSFGLTINSLLASFNMIPTIPFDGRKIYSWDKKKYYITLFLSIGLFIASFFI